MVLKAKEDEIVAYQQGNREEHEVLIKRLNELDEEFASADMDLMKVRKSLEILNQGESWLPNGETGACVAEGSSARAIREMESKVRAMPQYYPPTSKG